MMFSRRFVIGTALIALVTACGGGSVGSVSVLHAKGHPSGDGPAMVVVKNSSGVAIERLFVAKTEAVDAARASGVAPDSPGDLALWGNDQFDNAGLLEGHLFKSLDLPEGRYDILVVDHDHREQLVKHLALHAGGKYMLEIGTGWTQAR